MALRMSSSGLDAFVSLVFLTLGAFFLDFATIFVLSIALIFWLCRSSSPSTTQRQIESFRLVGPAPPLLAPPCPSHLPPKLTRPQDGLSAKIEWEYWIQEEFRIEKNQSLISLPMSPLAHPTSPHSPLPTALTTHSPPSI